MVRKSKFSVLLLALVTASVLVVYAVRAAKSKGSKEHYEGPLQTAEIVVGRSISIADIGRWRGHGSARRFASLTSSLPRALRCQSRWSPSSKAIRKADKPGF